jgi:arginine utilization protein RocB
MIKSLIKQQYNYTLILGNSGGFTMDKLRIKNILLELCKIPSISETNGELLMAQKLYEILNEIEYFKQNNELLYKVPLLKDAGGRSFIAALLKGSSESRKTVILLSHLDVVSVEDFGSLKDYAFSPEEYTQMLKTENLNLPKEAEEDLKSGDYLFGRGTMDMKFGIALDIEILHQLSENLKNFPGNVLFLSVPDEEANSAGMLEAIEFLNQLKQEHTLDYSCCIVSEPHFPKYVGDKSNYIYAGTVGKLLPVFYCTGKETHAGEPFSGLNPNLLTSRLIEKIEQNPELCESDAGCTTPAPVCLKCADTKSEYSVQIPTSAYAYFNLITLKKTPLEIMDRLKILAAEAFKEVLEEVKIKAEKWRRLTGDQLQIPSMQPRVYTYSELYQLCMKLHGSKLEQRLEDVIKNAVNTDLRQLSIEVVQELCKHSPDRTPMIVLFFAPPYYPSCSGLDSYPITQRICTDVINRAEKEYHERLQLQPYFTGLSDMSYLGLPNNINTEAFSKDFPLWGNKYSLPLSMMSQLNIPFINIGPLGKDAHKYTERLCLSYSFDMVSELVMDTVKNIILDKM